MSADGFIAGASSDYASNGDLTVGANWRTEGSHIMKHAISLLAIATAVCAPASALAQANAGGYYMPIPAPPPPVVYQSHFAPPGAYGAPGTYVYQSNPPPVAYRAPPVVYGYGNGQGGGWHSGWGYHRR